MGKKNAYGEFVCAVFYGINCEPEIAANLAQKLIEEFFQNFGTELQRLLIRLDRNSADDDTSDDDEDELGIMEYGVESVGDKHNPNKPQESIMAQFKSFDEIARRLQTRHVDRTKTTNY